MESYWMASEVSKARYEDLLRDAESARRFLTGKNARKLSAFWQFVIVLLG